MTIEIHSDWQSSGFDRAPVATAIGPFAGRQMLSAWWRHCGAGEVMFVESPEAFVPMERIGDQVRLLGDPDLFDYHSPLGTGIDKLLAAWVDALPTGTLIEFDSLPADVADLMMGGLSDGGLEPTAEVHESAAVLELPDDFDGYLGMLDKKQRHETRRKARRFTEILGAPRLERAAGDDAVAAFAAMHRLSGGRKGQFMDHHIEELFESLRRDAGGHVDFLYGSGPDPVAGAFGFEDAAAYYLYNSAYDPGAGAASPGIVLVSELIKQTIGAGLPRFDFLKGDEVYKYRLGAAARPLWRVTAAVGRST